MFLSLSISSKCFYLSQYLQNVFISLNIFEIFSSLSISSKYFPQVLALTTTEQAGSSVGLNFALLISQLTASLSSGAITADILPLAQTILQLEVTALPSPAIVGLLQSSLSSAQSLQISLLAQITNVQLKITELYSPLLSSVSFTITDISAAGETSQFTVSALPPSSQAGVSGSIAAFQTSQAALVSVESLVQATLSLDFSAISTAVTEVIIILSTNIFKQISPSCRSPSLSS